jgi:hypothetical protein
MTTAHAYYIRTNMTSSALSCVKLITRKYTANLESKETSLIFPACLRADPLLACLTVQGICFIFFHSNLQIYMTVLKIIKSIQPLPWHTMVSLSCSMPR